MPFHLPTFRPHPLVRGGHLQTVVGTYLPVRVEVESHLHRVPLADGDAIALHEDRLKSGGDTNPTRQRGESPVRAPRPALLRPTNESPQPRPIAILVHGLGGCHESGYMLRCSAKLLKQGVRVFRMDLRGCGAGLAWARHPLHAGRSEDAGAVLEYVTRQNPGAPLHLIGFSMGANIILKLAGELGNRAPASLASVLAVSPPIDLVECTKSIQRGVNQLYDRRFVRSLLQHIRRRTLAMPDALSRPLEPTPRRLLDFDSQFTAPLAGFADVDDYYTQASSGPWLKHIAVPTLIIAAVSDPIVPVRSFELASYSPTTQLAIMPCGGHLGFIAAAGADTDRRWLDWRVVEWVLSHAAGSQQLPIAHDTDERSVKDAVAAGIHDRRAVG